MEDNIVEIIENLIATLELITVGVDVQLRPQESEIMIIDDDGKLTKTNLFINSDSYILYMQPLHHNLRILNTLFRKMVVH